jgi:hypothetical protein
MMAVPTDRILYWPTTLAVAWAMLFIWSNTFGGGGAFLDPLLVFFCGLVCAGAGIIASFAALFEGSWRRLLSPIVLPLSIAIFDFNLKAAQRLAYQLLMAIYTPM